LLLPRFPNMSKIGRLRIALRELLTEHERDGALPTSGRFLFYELVQRGIISKERKAQGGRRPGQNMNEALMDLRERGDVPWEWIVDETRSHDDYRGASTLLSIIILLGVTFGGPKTSR